MSPDAASAPEVRLPDRMDNDRQSRPASPTGSTRDLLAENDRLRRALNDIVNASRDDGLAAMVNWMRDRACAALGGEDGE